MTGADVMVSLMLAAPAAILLAYLLSPPEDKR